MTLVEAIRALVAGAGVQNVYIVDAPESLLSAGAVVVIPYGADTYETLPIGVQHFQIRVSAASFAASEALCWQAFRALADKTVAGADRRCVSCVAANQEPFFLGKEGALYIHEFNVQVTACWKE